MALELIVDSVESLPADVQSEYVQQEDGTYKLDVQGVVPKSKLDEFRENNINIRKEAEAKSKELQSRISQLETIAERYGTLGEDPDQVIAEIKDLKALKEQVDNKELIEAKGFEEALEDKLNKRVGTLREEYEARIKELEDAKNGIETQLSERLSTTEQRYRQVALESVIKDEAVKAGALAGSVDDILSRANRAGWTIGEDGGAIAMQNGEPLYGADGEKLTIKEWVGNLKKDASWFFKPNAGGGAGGDSNGTPPPRGGEPLSAEALQSLSPAEYAAYRRKQQGK